MKSYKTKLMMSKWFVLELLFILVLIGFIRQFMDYSWGDAVEAFNSVLSKDDPNSYLLKYGNIFSAVCNYTDVRFQTWTSRNLIEVIVVLVCAAPSVVWQCLDLIVCGLLVFLFDRLIEIEDKRAKAAVMLMFLSMYPILQMSTAGWVATTMYYTWPFSTMLAVFIYIKNHWNFRTIKVFPYFLSLLAATYAFNMEQAAALAVILFCASCLAYRKQCPSWFYTYGMIALVELIISLLCPGNAARYINNTEYWFPEYINYNFLDKCYLGYSHTINIFLYSNHFVVYCFMSLLTFSVFEHSKNYIHRILSLVPISFYSFLRLFVDVDFNNSYIDLFRAPCAEGQLYTLNSYNLLTIVVSLIICCCIIISLYNAVQNKREKIICCGILLGGIGTHMMMGFSPTIYASNTRTLMYAFFCLIYLCMFLISKSTLLLNKLKRPQNVEIVAFCGIVIAVANSLTVYNWIQLLLDNLRSIF